MTAVGDTPPPVVLTVRLAGRRVVVVGAGWAAERKLSSLLDAAAAVDVVAPEATATVAGWAAAGRLRWLCREYRHGDVAGAFLAVAATGRRVVDERVAADAEAAATLCVRSAGAGDTALAATVRRGPLQVAVSTDGMAPALATRIREEIAARYGAEYGELASLLGALRADPEVRRQLSRLDADHRRAAWRSILDTDILTLIRTGHPAAAREVASACLSSSSD